MKSVKNIVRALALALTAVSIAAAVSVPAFAAQPDAASMQPILTASAEDIDAENGAVLVAQDEYAKAYVDASGKCGHIVLSDKFATKSVLSSIGGKPLKEIIKFNDGGYVDRFYTKQLYDDHDDSLFKGCQYQIVVDAAGPKGFWNGSGYMTFYDGTGDYYGLSIWDSNFKTHTVWYDSYNPQLTSVYWSY